jgi:hypothetical protein
LRAKLFEQGGRAGPLSDVSTAMAKKENHRKDPMKYMAANVDGGKKRMSPSGLEYDMK